MITERRANLALRLALAAIVLAVFSHTRADPDLWGHVRFGGDMVSARTVHVADRYSFTSDRPWINHEWLAEIVIYGAYRAAGGTGLILLKIALLAMMAAALLRTIRGIARSPTDGALLLGLAVVATVPQANHVRPQLFSLALIAWLHAILHAAGQGRVALLWLAVPMMALWANLHGGWIVGLGVLGLWAAANVVTKGRASSGVVLLATGAAIVATLVNPYGWKLWAFLRETVGVGRADITEWQPIIHAGYPIIILWLVVAAAAVVACMSARRTKSVDLRAWAVVAALAVLSFRVNRLLAFFGLAVVMLAGRPLADAASRLTAARRPRVAPRVALAGAFIIAVLLLAGSVTASIVNARCVRMDLPIYPDASVTAAASARAIRGRMLTWFDWGEYAIWHFSPGVLVSVDGRRETVYSDEIVQQHLRFYFLPEERSALVSALRPDFVFLPRHLAVADRLQADGWIPLAAGPASVLLARGNVTPAAADWEPAAARCFPGP